MQNSVEASGKTIEQALQKALRELNARAEDVDIEILPAPSKGFLGGLFGSKMVSIRVTPREAKSTSGNHVETLKGMLAKLLGLMGVDYELTIETLPDTTFMNINTSGLDGLLIGRRGETLASLQHIVNRVFTSTTGEHSKITVDVGGYVKRKHRLLVERARKIADRVRKTGKEFDFEPLKASDRRIIHLAVSEVSDVSTYTIGDGLLRKVVIAPKSVESAESPARGKGKS
jgi:spoIIIJ-associated protein